MALYIVPFDQITNLENAGDLQGDAVIHAIENLIGVTIIRPVTQAGRITNFPAQYPQQDERPC